MLKPSQEYTIHILDDEEFDKLPFGDPSEAYGMSDAVKKTAWVRRTRVQGFDVATINHEFDELMAKTSLHEENGIRYKKAKDIFRSIFNIIPGLGNTFFGAPAAPAQPSFNFQPQETTSAFSPGPVTASPLSDLDFKTGLSNIDINRQNQRGSVFSQFRGLGAPQQNSAFSRNLADVDTSISKTRQQFIQDQEERKRAAGLA